MIVIFALLFLIAVFSFLGMGALDCWFQVSAVHYGVSEFLKRQMPGTHKEGFHLKIPFLERVKQVHMRPRTISIEVPFTAANKLKLVAKGSIQYKADPRVVDDDGRNVFYRQSDAAIETGLQNDVKAKLGGLGGQYDGQEFYKNRIAISDFINQNMRTKVPLHLRQTPPVPANGILQFYNEQWQDSKKALDTEKEMEADRSKIEERYGIDIITVSISEIAFTPETERALEEQQQAEMRAGVGENLLALGDKLMRKFKKAPQGQVLDVADAVVLNRPRNILSASGFDKGVLPIINIQTDDSAQDKPKGKKDK